MADISSAQTDEALPPKRLGRSVLIGLMFAALLGGGSFYAVYTGMVLPTTPSPSQSVATLPDDMGPMGPLPNVSYVAIDPIVINLGAGSDRRHLKFSASIEVVPRAESEVTRLMPRIVDVLNGYLRAVSVEELEKAGALVKIRSHMLRRIQVVTGEGRVRDLLIQEFVLN